MCWDLTLSVDPTPSAPVAARSLAAQTAAVLRGPAGEQVMRDCILVLTELVNNAVYGGATSLQLDVHLHRQRLVVGVTHDGYGLLVPGMPTLDRHDGRSLATVAALSQSWGVQELDAGRRVWAMLAVPPEATVDLDCDEEPLQTVEPATGRHASSH